MIGQFAHYQQMIVESHPQQTTNNKHIKTPNLLFPAPDFVSEKHRSSNNQHIKYKEVQEPKAINNDASQDGEKCGDDASCSGYSRVECPVSGTGNFQKDPIHTDVVNGENDSPNEKNQPERWFSRYQNEK